MSASRAPRSRAVIPNATTVLDGDRIEESLSLSLDDALRYVPGLQVTRQGGRGGRSELYLRGLDPNHVVVLVDGVRLNDPTNSRGGSFDPTTLALLDVEKVEIVRGPLSTVYGSDALAGAINVITRSGRPGEAPETSVRVRGGRFESGSAVAQGRTGIGKHLGLSLGARSLPVGAPGRAQCGQEDGGSRVRAFHRPYVSRRAERLQISERFFQRQRGWRYCTRPRSRYT